MKRILKVVLVISFFSFILLSVFQYSALNIDYFENKFEENNTDRVTGISEEKLLDISKEIIRYLEGDRKDLLIEIGDEKGYVFGDREVKHMEDVEKLFRIGFFIKNVFLTVSILSFFILKFYYKEKLKTPLIAGGIIFSLILAAIGVIIVFNFEKAFIIFHEILFDNDLWILNPKEDVLIQMLPSNFFSDLGFLIVKRYILILIIIIVSLLMIPKIKTR
jgi:integral membrane protein (TIGR01906 family)